MITMINHDDLLACARSGSKPSLQKSGVWLRRRGGRSATLLRSLLRWQAAQLTACVPTTMIAKIGDDDDDDAKNDDHHPAACMERRFRL